MRRHSRKATAGQHALLAGRPQQPAMCLICGTGKEHALFNSFLLPRVGAGAAPAGGGGVAPKALPCASPLAKFAESTVRIASIDSGLEHMERDGRPNGKCNHR